MILVDKIFKWPGPRGYNEWCHMVSTNNLVELHEFAERLGLKREWFQDKRMPHYDLTASKRRLAVKLGAKEVSARELQMCFSKEP